MTTSPQPRSPQKYLDQIDPAILASFNAQQLAATYAMLDGRGDRQTIAQAD